MNPSYPTGKHRGQHKRHPFRWILGILAVIVFVAVLAGILSNQGGVSKVAASPTASGGSAARSAPSSPKVDDATNGVVGDTFTITDHDTNGNQVTYRVKLTDIDPHAKLTDFATLDNPADHMEAAHFTISGVSGTANDDALTDALGIVASTDTVTPSLNSVTDGGSFNSGTFNVGPGQVQSGWVPFEVPKGQTLKSVQWVPDAGMGSAAATWRIP